MYTTLFNLKQNYKFLSEGKKDIGEKVHEKVLLCDANYDRKNNDSTNALRPRRFK